MIQSKLGVFNKGECMKKTLLTLLLLGLAVNAYAGTIEERKDFYTYFDPSSTTVYSQALATSTGDQVAVNGYTKKTIQVESSQVGEYIHINVDGRLNGMIDTGNWTTLDTIEYGITSADTSKNIVLDVTEMVDFLRVGVRSEGTAGTSYITIKGVFTNVDR